MSSGAHHDDEFSRHIEAVARRLWGEPNAALSKPGRELRFGSHGGRGVDLQKGVWRDYSDEVGGGVLDLIVREGEATDRAGAVEWLREQGFPIEDRRPANGNGHAHRKAPRESSEDDHPFAPGGAADRARGERTSGPGDRADGPRFDVVQTWGYVDEAGELLFEVVRMENGQRDPETGKKLKQYRQRYPDPANPGKWVWKKSPRQVPYRLPDVVEAVRQGVVVTLVEGEKVADAFWEIGVPATTNAMGAGKFPPELLEFFRGAHVAICPDPDEAGIKHRDLLIEKITPVAKSVRVVNLPGLSVERKEDGYEWVERGGSAEDFMRLYELAPVIRPEPFKSKFGAVMWRDLDAPGPVHEHLVEDLVTRGEVCMLAGPSGSGKSFLTISLGMAVARGIPFFGRQVMQGAVIYHAGESSLGVRRKRLPAYRAYHGVSLDEDIPFALLTKPLNLYASDDDVAAFIAECKGLAAMMSHRLELVVIDTLSAATPGMAENHSEDVGPVLARCERIKAELGCAVMLVHHMNADGTKARGHTSITANLDSVITCRKVEDHHDADKRQIREVKLGKMKDGDDDVSWRFVLPAVEIGTSPFGKPVTSCVAAEPNNGVAGDQIDPNAPADDGIRLSTQAEVFLVALHKALKEQGETPPADLALPSYINKVVEWKRFTETFSAMTMDGADEADPVKKANAVRVALHRHGTYLMAKKVIGRIDQEGLGKWVWLTGKKVRGFTPPSDVITPKKKKGATYVPPALPDEIADEPVPGFDDTPW
jgi:hypothetical protein